MSQDQRTSLYLTKKKGTEVDFYDKKLIRFLAMSIFSGPLGFYFPI